MNPSLRLTAVDLPSLMAHLSRASIGFDRMFDDLHQAAIQPNNSGYPPHNIVKYNELSYAIEIAVAGFAEEELNITVENNVLTITGNQSERTDTNHEYLHRGISARSFTKVLNLAEHTVVKGAKYVNGLLVINVDIEIPEALKPKKIEINGAKCKQIETS